MKYYKIDFRTYFELDRVPSRAEGEKIPNAEDFFWKMNKGEIILNAPIFDYFYLKSFDKKEYWEWKLCDALGFIGEGSQIRGWYISDDLKLLLENFNIALKYHFYETKLLYKERKLRYWIFQFPIEPYQNIDFKKSTFKLDQDDNVYGFQSEEEYLLFYRKEHRETKRKLKTIKVCLKDNFDIIYTTNNDIVVSEKLKNVIEENDIEGFEFSELDYEVGVRK